jgi:hypothetical protein
MIMQITIKTPRELLMTAMDVPPFIYLLAENRPEQTNHPEQNNHSTQKPDYSHLPIHHFPL